MYGSIEYSVNDIHFPMERISSLPLLMKYPEPNGKCSKGFHRSIRVKNAFLQDVRLIGIEIQNDNDGYDDSSAASSSNKNLSSLVDCRKHFKIYDFEGSDFNTNYSRLSTAKHWIPKRTLFIPPKNVLHKMKKWMKHVLQKALTKRELFIPPKNVLHNHNETCSSKQRSLFMFA